MSLDNQSLTLSQNLSHRIFSLVPYVSLTTLFLFFLTLILISTITPRYASAESSNTHAGTNGTTFNVSVSDNIAITATPTTVTIDAQPNALGAFASNYTTIDVSTSNETGYTLSMNAENGDLVNESDNTKKISNLDLSTLTTAQQALGITEAEFSTTDNTAYNNMWGVSILDTSNDNTNSALSTILNGNYHPLALVADTKIIKETSTPNNSSTTSITIGTKVDTNLPTGTYTDTITFTAVANYVPTTKTLADITTMQEMTPEICDATPASPVNETPTIYYLQDKRGGGYDNSSTGTGAAAPLNTDTSGENTYAVAKLADNKCWMLQNLNIVGTTITAADSDFSGDDITLPNALFETSNNTINELHSYYVDNADVDRNRHTGAYYNWYTATAKTGTASMTDGHEATSSICPAGWRLPKAGTAAGNNSNYFYNLLNRYTIAGKGSWDSSNNRWSGDARDGLANAPLYLPTAGYVVNSAVSNKASHGFYWSNMAQSASSAYVLGFYSNIAAPRNYSAKYAGFSVRCVHKDTRTISDIATMQEINDYICANTEAGVIAYLQDKRGGGYDNSATSVGAADPLNADTSGNNTYAVSKLLDGRCWMLQNLNIVGQTISAEDSDFSGEDIILPNALFVAYSKAVDELHSYYVDNADVDRNRHTGAYYNWYTATAKTGTASMTDGREASSSICPAGWHLPKAGTKANNSSNYFFDLLSRYTIAGKGPWNSSGYWSGNAMDGLADSPLYLPSAGRVHDNAVALKADYGYYWSSMAQSADDAYSLVFFSGYTYTRTKLSKNTGSSIRCVTN